MCEVNCVGFLDKIFGKNEIERTITTIKEDDIPDYILKMAENGDLDNFFLVADEDHKTAFDLDDFSNTKKKKHR